MTMDGYERDASSTHQGKGKMAKISKTSFYSLTELNSIDLSVLVSALYSYVDQCSGTGERKEIAEDLIHILKNMPETFE